MITQHIWAKSPLVSVNCVLCKAAEGFGANQEEVVTGVTKTSFSFDDRRTSFLTVSEAVRLARCIRALLGLGDSDLGAGS